MTHDDASVETGVGGQAKYDVMMVYKSNLLQERPQFSVTVPGEFVEQILNIKEWLKSPWALESDPNDA